MPESEQGRRELQDTGTHIACTSFWYASVVPDNLQAALGGLLPEKCHAVIPMNL